MIDKNNFQALLTYLGFTEQQNIYSKIINDIELKVDFNNQQLIYPQDLKADRETTKNFSQNENFVVFECVHALLTAGYQPKHIILEQGMPGGHGETGGFCDIIIQDNNKKPYLLIECKTADDGKSKEFTKAWNKMLKNGGQLFNYYNSYRQAEYICLYASDFKNNKLNQTYHLISMRDNEDYISSLTTKNLKSYTEIASEQGGKDDFFQVWKNTYQYDYITHNLFESKTFEVGNRPFNIHDLKVVDNDEIQKKYHQFATIMRQYAVSGRENAFDKLVNLFLCKVVDENKNPNNLKVYWQGSSSDNYFNLQDRLQKLYKTGMYDFLGEDVTYIEEEEINKAFHLIKNKKDETKKTILEYFKQLKFYSNNPFAFIDVHNESLFLQNAVILKEVVQMLQDIKLKNEDEQHQFLGDLFEGFLDQGVKQSEGQFFTPMPIVKFLVSSLPLTHIIEQEHTPKVIDYACGAGHFLTEYASQIKTILGTEQKEQLKKHYANIYGIEKEYRLSKVAKVSAFMYGQDDINIIYADALAQHDKIKDNDFSILIANPPYSVKGFLTTLSEEDKEKFSLYNDLNEDSFNSIETFFIEKAKQLLKADGVGAIILPSSILTNGNIYIKCRELILKYFNIIAIAEFGSNTFGKTGTNTVTLFLRRKQIKPDLAEHYKNRVEDWFSENFSDDNIFEDHNLLQQYCQHCGLDIKHYQAFLKNQEHSLFETEHFIEYYQEFDKREVKNIKNAKFFKDFSEQEQQHFLNQQFTQFVRKKEQEKLYFYLLARSNPQDVLVIKSPSDNKEMKQFLGYEWSSAKGNEGIKYIGSTSSDDEDSINRNQGIFQIKTPLFNPHNLADESKLNTLVRKHFLGEYFEISEENQTFATLLPLTQMLDFSRTIFDKAIRTNVQKKIEIVSKYPLVKLKELTEIIRGITYNKNEQVLERTKNIILPADNISLEGHFEINKEIFLEENKELDDTKRLKQGDIFICFSSGSEKHIGKLCYIENETPYFAGGFMGILRSFSAINAKFLFNFLNQEYMRNIIRQLSNGNNIKNLSTSIGEVKIPLPPLEIQQQIVAECEKVDTEYANSRMQIETYRAKIAQIFIDLEVLEKSHTGG